MQPEFDNHNEHQREGIFRNGLRLRVARYVFDKPRFRSCTRLIRRHYGPPGGPVLTDNLYELFESRFPAESSSTFIETEDGRVYSYVSMVYRSGRYARLLSDLGVTPGDRVLAQVEKSPEAVFLYLACLRAGAVFLPLNTAYQRDEVAYFLNDAEPAAVVIDPAREAELAPLTEQAGCKHLLTLDAAGSGTLEQRSAALDGEFGCLPRAADDLAAMLYTSGTTGRSKGAMLSHGNLAANAQALHQTWGFQHDDLLLHALPIYHAHGLFVAINCVLLNGTGMLFLPKFDAESVLRLLPRATVMMGVPTFYTRLLTRPDFGAEVCRNIRVFIAGSAPLLAETFNEFQERSGHTILERYGMSETGMNSSNPLEGERKAGSVGRPLPGVELRVVGEDGSPLGTDEIGDLEVRGPNVFKGYWRNAEKTAESFRDDGFFVTGDLAKIDGEGYVHLVGRAKDLIISGGFNVYPKEIEQVIDEIEGVGESAVIGLPHPDFGEAVAAVVTPAAGSAAPSEAAIISATKGRLANFKVPKRVFQSEALPRNAMGKVQKNLLRERYAAAFKDAD